MSCIKILASMCVLYKFYLHNKIEIVCMVVLVVGSESSQNWVRVVSGLGPIRLGSEKYQGSELSWVRVVRLPRHTLAKVPQRRLNMSCHVCDFWTNLFEDVSKNNLSKKKKKKYKNGTRRITILSRIRKT